jgi:hypothetical protein
MGPGGVPIFVLLPLPEYPMKFGNLEKFGIEVNRPWTKFPKDDSLQKAPKFAGERFPQFGELLEAPASPEIGTDAAQIGPENLGYPTG